MADTPFVSVLMTSYNREKYIAEAIESVLASTYTNFELIIVDDCSMDKTVEIANSYAAKNKRVMVFVNEKNLGDYPNRNKAASYARGKYLKFVDADDIIYPHGLEILVNSMEKFQDVNWGLCSLRQDDERMYPFKLTPKEAYEYHYLGPGLFHKAPLSSIIKKDVFNKVGGFGPIRMAGDNDMWHRLAQKYPLILMQDGIVWYRKHDEQEMNVYHQFRGVYRNIMLSYLKSDNCPLNSKTASNIFRRQRQQALISVLKSLLRFKFKIFLEEINFYKSLR